VKNGRPTAMPVATIALLMNQRSTPIAARPARPWSPPGSTIPTNSL
jgi:hypothetical protein